MNKVGMVAKAIVAGATAFLGSWATAYADKSVDSGEWVYVTIATIVAAAAVWATPNTTESEEQK
jgi:hypothetical protein